ncbi:ATP synthase F0F1 subunit B [Paenibacillus darwinianus]|uniref:ATP synthase subunit b n=1 Tax=Paenibacillus darwinianus TaxID=1380763 RepID=A0A9W5S112_9BACL|nr:F0F1 ATP synthase subunit B [Paenibacillus darwinianus]EXX87375.1 ATP synthase F0F1 subunit B [Paenibacillus darwinianus]EXX87422.1 ATP synthase F0F1 subunit B [Paenibacillus darwinianus]EXX88831.1 ATP synthase F0F1 subunit B [Paenibacillus darwinianus]
MEFNWESTVITMIAFLGLYLLLNKYAFGPLFAIMEKRRELVKEEISAAESSRKEAERNMEEQKQALQQVRKEAHDIIEQARATSTKQADDILAAAKTESVRLKDEAVKDIENEKNKAIAALRSQVSGMSVLIASKIIEKQIDEKSQEQLVDRYLNEVGKSS